MPPIDEQPVIGPAELTIGTLTSDFERLQKQKSRKTGGVEARVLLALAFTWGEQYVSQSARGIVSEKLDPNKLNLVFNLIGPRVAKVMGRLFAFDPQYKARPDKKDPAAFSEAEVVDKLIRALDEKLDQPSKTWEILHWLIVGGVAFEHVPWVPDAVKEPVPQFDDMGELLFKHKQSGEIVPESVMQAQVAAGLPHELYDIYQEVALTGEVGSEVLGPFNVFVDQSVKSLTTLAPDQAVYIAKFRTRGWIEENYGQIELEKASDLKIVTTSFFQDGDSTASLFLKDMIPTVQGQAEDKGPDVFVVVERYQPSSKLLPEGRYTVFVPDQAVLLDAPNPYGEIPIVDFHYTPVSTTFWTKDYVTDLIAPQRFVNKRLSQLGEQANAAIYDKILLGGGLTEDDIPADYPGVVKGGVNETGVPWVQRLAGPDLPSWFLNSIETVTKMFNDIAGGTDLFQESKFPGQLRGPMAVPMMQEILDTQFGPLFRHLGDRMAKVKQMRLNRVKAFYPPIRTLNFTDRGQKDEVMVFHTDQLLKAGTNFNITVEKGSLLPELRSMREARIIERLSTPLAIIYQDDRTGQIDKSKVAADLNMGDEGREGRESQARKFARQLIELLYKGDPVPPVMPFWDHAPMLDELEGEMQTTEFLRASQPMQQVFFGRWQEHTNILTQKAQAAQEAQNAQGVQNAVAQATQQAAAQAASETVDSVMEQLRAQAGMASQTGENVRGALEDGGGFPRGLRRRQPGE